MTIFIFVSCDTTGNGDVVTPSPPTLDGTWVNPDYDGTSGGEDGGSPAKTVTTDNGDGTYTAELYDYVSDIVPTATMTLTVKDEWTDSEGNFFLKIEALAPGPVFIYELVMIHSDGLTMEVTLSDVDYPTEIDPTGWYAIYYRP